MNSPYAELPARSFWKTGVSAQSPETVTGLWKPKFRIDSQSVVATAGSCFAQHIARHLRSRGYSVLDVEPPPPGLSEDNAQDFGYSIYSARYGNIYTMRHFLQLLQEVFEDLKPANLVWEKNGRFYDAMRPSVEPKGLATAKLVLRHRQQHLRQVRKLFTDANVIVFTMGLTEGWMHRKSGTVYPTAPGTIAGTYDPADYVFKNFDFVEILQDFLRARKIIMRHNRAAKFLVTVSPVPLTATASDQHVLVATTYSKSVLRAVAGKLAADYDNVDYFPSYEIIASPFSGAKFYKPGLREVADEGVQTVMRVFFSDQAAGADEQAAITPAPATAAVPTLQAEAAPIAVERPAARPARASRDDRLAARAQLRAERDQERAERLKQHAERKRVRPGTGATPERRRAKSKEDVVCEDALLEAFAR